MKGPAIWARKCPIILGNFAVGQDPRILWKAPGCRIKGKPQAERPLPLLGDVAWMTTVESRSSGFVVKDAEIIQQSNKQVELIG